MPDPLDWATTIGEKACYQLRRLVIEYIPYHHKHNGLRHGSLKLASELNRLSRIFARYLPDTTNQDECRRKDEEYADRQMFYEVSCRSLVLLLMHKGVPPSAIEYDAAKEYEVRSSVGSWEVAQWIEATAKARTSLESDGTPSERDVKEALQQVDTHRQLFSENNVTFSAR